MAIAGDVATTADDSMQHGGEAAGWLLRRGVGDGAGTPEG